MKGFLAFILSLAFLVCGCQEGEPQGTAGEGTDPALEQAKEAAREAVQKAENAQKTAAEAKGAAVEALEAAENAELNAQNVTPPPEEQ